MPLDVNVNAPAGSGPTLTAPSIPGIPTISGTPQVGQVLTATPSTPVSGNPTPTRTWQWLRGGTAISGATNAAYTPVTDDVGAALSVRQTETNSEGVANATSNVTAAIIAAGSTPITLSLAATASAHAPVGIQFTATATSPAARVEIPFHDIEYVWDFGDTGNYRYLDNSSLWGTAKNRAHGAVVSHVFSDPGTYTVTCTAYDGENTPAVQTIQVVVTDPETVFSGTKTAVVSTAGNFAGAPSGAQQFTSISAAVSAMSGDQDQRIMLRYGETYTEALRFTEQSGSGKRLMVDAFGTSSDGNPKIDRSSGGGNGIVFETNQGNTATETVRNVDYEGNVDPTDQTPGTARNGSGIVFSEGTGDMLALKTVWGCRLTNSPNMSIDANASVTGGREVQNLFVGDTFYDGWMDYGMLLGVGGIVGICGCKFQQPIGTVNGLGKGTSPHNWADHGPFRASTPIGPMTFHNCDFRSLNSWSGTSGSNYPIQPCVRWMSGKGGAADYDQVLVIDRMRAEGRPPAAVNETSGHTRKNMFALLDRVYAVLTSHQAMPISHGGTTVRNSVFVRPNIKSPSSSGIQNDAFGNASLIQDGGAQYDSGLNAGNLRRIEIYSCTFADLVTDANSSSRNGSSARNSALPETEVVNSNYDNNVAWFPNRSSATTADGPLQTGTDRWTSGFNGLNLEQNALDASFVYPSGTLDTFDLLTSAGGIGAATSGKVSLIDFYGSVRATVLSGLTRSTPSKGHIEPALEA